MTPLSSDSCRDEKSTVSLTITSLTAKMSNFPTAAGKIFLFHFGFKKFCYNADFLKSILLRLIWLLLPMDLVISVGKQPLPLQTVCPSRFLSPLPLGPQEAFIRIYQCVSCRLNGVAPQNSCVEIPTPHTMAL